MKLVYRVMTLAEAGLLRELLAEAGIPASVFNQFSVGAVGEIPCDCGWPQLWVHRDHQYQRARELLLAHERRQRGAAQDWRCGCGESNPEAFEICWSCGADVLS